MHRRSGLTGWLMMSSRGCALTAAQHSWWKQSWSRPGCRARAHSRQGHARTEHVTVHGRGTAGASVRCKRAMRCLHTAPRHASDCACSRACAHRACNGCAASIQARAQAALGLLSSRGRKRFGGSRLRRSLRLRTRTTLLWMAALTQ
jgi:hypothetical protein